MSAEKAAARPPADSMRRTRASSRSNRRATTATTAPSRARSSAVAAPIPEEAPVMRAILSFNANLLQVHKAMRPSRSSLANHPQQLNNTVEWLAPSLNGFSRSALRPWVRESRGAARGLWLLRVACELVFVAAGQERRPYGRIPWLKPANETRRRRRRRRRVFFATRMRRDRMVGRSATFATCPDLYYELAATRRNRSFTSMPPAQRFGGLIYMVACRGSCLKTTNAGHPAEVVRRPLSRQLRF